MTVWDHYDRIAEAYQDRVAIVDQQGAVLTHGQLREQAAAIGSGLATLGLSSGDRIGGFLPNRATWPILALGAAHQGVGVLGLNTRFREAELNHLLQVAEVECVVCADLFLGCDSVALLSGLDVAVRPIVTGAPPQSSTDSSETEGPIRWSTLIGTDAVEPAGGPGDPLIGFTTSGTTGFPKVAMHTQRQALSHLLATADSFALTSSSVSLVPLPMCGAFGYTVAMATLLAGGTVIAHETWDPDAAAAAIADHGVTHFYASDDMLLAVVASDAFVPETTWTGGGFADFTNSGPAAVDAAAERTNGTVRLTGLYGSSEGFALMSTWHPSAPAEDRSRNGGYLVSAETEVRCQDPETGALLDRGEPGELVFRGPSLITGYVNNQEATDKVFDQDGWYRSGDLGYVVEPDERGHQGFVFLARLGDSLRLRGFLCDPAEIEHHLETHPAVELAQVVGVARPSVGEVAVAFVRLDERTTTEATQETIEAVLQAHCREGLANYKRPERVVIVDSFPVTDGPNGVKIRKVDLRERAAALFGS